jgi:hypothetical protein
MKRWLHKIEIWVDRLIPYMLVVLAGIIIIEIFFHDIAEHHHTIILIGDSIVISVFVLDLIFKYIRIRNIPRFLKKSWLDIIAVFPFFLFFRAAEFFIGAVSIGIGETASTVQTILHEGLEVEKEGAKILEAIEKEGARSARLTRSSRFTRFLRVFARGPRFLKAVPFYAKPTGKHHPHEKTKS